MTKHKGKLIPQAKQLPVKIDIQVLLVGIFIFPGLGESEKSASILKFTYSWLRDVVPAPKNK